MGKTPKPLRISVSEDIAQWPEIVLLAKQGHLVTVHTATDMNCDLILDERAWRMTEELRPYLDMAIKAARKVKYGKGKE